LIRFDSIALLVGSSRRNPSTSSQGLVVVAPKTSPMAWVSPKSAPAQLTPRLGASSSRTRDHSGPCRSCPGRGRPLSRRRRVAGVGRRRSPTRRTGHTHSIGIASIRGEGVNPPGCLRHLRRTGDIRGVRCAHVHSPCCISQGRVGDRGASLKFGVHGLVRAPHSSRPLDSNARPR